ncbi:hypothetical protein [Methanospirillum sp.]
MKKKHAPESDEKRFAIMVDAAILLHIGWLFLSNLVQSSKILINLYQYLGRMLWSRKCVYHEWNWYNSCTKSGKGGVTPL